MPQDYVEFRRDVMNAVLNGASPEQIADLLESCYQAHPEIGDHEIIDLRARCNGCWRDREDCERHPCDKPTWHDDDPPLTLTRPVLSP